MKKQQRRPICIEPLYRRSTISLIKSLVEHQKKKHSVSSILQSVSWWIVVRFWQQRFSSSALYCPQQRGRWAFRNLDGINVRLAEACQTRLDVSQGLGWGYCVSGCLGLGLLACPAPQLRWLRGLGILTSGFLSRSQVLGVAFVRFSNLTDTPVTVMNLPTVVFSFVWGTVIWVKDHGRSKTSFSSDYSSSQVEYRLKDWHRCWQGREILGM